VLVPALWRTAPTAHLGIDATAIEATWTPLVRASLHTRSRRFEVSMSWDVARVVPLSHYEIFVELEDGRKGVFDLKPYLDHGVFKELRNEGYFKEVSIEFGAVTWPNGQDIAPETLLAELEPGVPAEVQQ
jgi:hypothetical protein